MPKSIEDIITNPQIAASAIHGRPLEQRTPAARAAGRLCAERALAFQEARMQVERYRISHLRRLTFPDAANDNVALVRRAAA